jgi:ATP-dependent Lhr-like helicase
LTREIDFHPAIKTWFEGRFCEPTEPQKRGWPLISRGCNTLILAPTGSGKTLAAFLAAIDRVLRDLEANVAPRHGVEILYISPLKALNYDIERNLSEPLREIGETANSMGYALPEIRTAVRTGDTPANERRRMVSKPPHILITTPESLHIILTSSARKVLQTVRYVVVDEIHSLSSNKRGVFLAVLLERLEDICQAPPVRIGLSATQKPLSEVARFLGGFDDSGKPRSVEIVDAGISREADLKVVCTVDDLRHPEGDSVWPSICRKLLELVRTHRSTIIFANTRRVVEKLTLGINELAGEELVRPHHGSVSAPVRRQTEEALKNGILKGVVATGTLELGIDMGAVELVCQVESPKEVSRGLQRIGRAGHAHKAVSKGRIIAKTTTDLAEAVSVAQGMLEGDIEPIRVPKNCLDVLAQQIVAMAALDGIACEDAYRTVKRAYPFQELSEEAFNLTLQLVSGRYPSKAFRELKARVSLDRVTGRISPLPGSQRLVISNGGAIPDAGEYGVYLADTNLKLGELDEEFVYESREGDVFSLGTNNWKIVKIDVDKVIVSRASVTQARLPFWRGENVPRSARTGRRMGKLLRELAEKGDKAKDWALRNLPVDEWAAENLCRFVKSRIGVDGESASFYKFSMSEVDSALPTDKRIVLEAFNDEVGGRRLALVSVFGGRVHQALRIALSALIKREIGVEPETISRDNGILFRLPDPVGTEIAAYGESLLRMLTPDLAYDLIMEDLPNTALFGLRFRQNAARALLLPSAGPGKRTPLWLQRLKAKDLLAIAKQFDGFPIVVETFRECLQDYLELDELREILRQVQCGEIEISAVERKTPSPFVSAMLLDFQMVYQYEWDEPKLVGKRRSMVVERRLVDELIECKVARRLDERAIADLDRRLQGIDEHRRARTAEELYELVREIGDLSEENAAEAVVDPGLVNVLVEEGRLLRVKFPNARYPHRLIACDYLNEYLQAILGQRDAIETILDRHFSRRAVIDPTEVARDYGFPADVVIGMVDRMTNAGELVEIAPAPETQTPRWTSPKCLEVIYRRTLAAQRREAKPVAPVQYSEFLIRWQHLHPRHRLQGYEGIRTVLRQLEAVRLPYILWEPDIMARRVTDFRTELIDNACLSSEFVWIGQGSDFEKTGNLAFLAREGLPVLLPMLQVSASGRSFSEHCEAVRNALCERGASFLVDLVLDTGLDSRTVQRALWELIWAGEVTHDYFSILRSSKPASVDHPKGTSSQAGRRDRIHYYRTRSRIARSFTLPPNPNPGRWVLLSSFSRHETDELESLEIYARILLERYGIVAKDLVQRPGEPDVLWSDLYRVYQRMELAGEIERGYFVEGLAGAQFGLPEVIDDLLGRSHFGSDQSSSDSQPVLLNSCDPAYLFSAAGPFNIGTGRINRLPSNYVVLLNGLPAITVELGSGTLRLHTDLTSESLAACILELVHMTDSPWPIRPYRKVEISYFGTESVIGSSIEGLLRSAGFEEENNRLVLRSFAQQ